MTFRVDYGFSPDEEVIKNNFLKNFKQKQTDDTVLYTGACFSGYMRHRILRPEAVNSNVYYRLLCNVDMLKELIEWINSLNSGIKVKFIKSIGQLYLVGTEYTIENYVRKPQYVDFKFGRQLTELITKRKLKESGVNNYLPISRCTVELIIDEASIEEKALLEYITMVVIRALDYNESFLDRMTEEGKDLPIIERILLASNGQDMGHSIYCGSKADKEYATISSQVLAKVINLENIKNACKMERHGDLSYFRQTPIIDYVLRNLKKERNEKENG